MSEVSQLIIFTITSALTVYGCERGPYYEGANWDPEILPLPLPPRQFSGEREEQQKAAFIADKRGAVAVVTALVMPVMVWTAALALDTGGLFAYKSYMQAVADAAAVSAATTASVQAGKGIAGANGFPDGVGNIQVVVAAGACGADTCYRVTIQDQAAVIFAPDMVRIAATAVAEATPSGAVLVE